MATKVDFVTKGPASLQAPPVEAALQARGDVDLATSPSFVPLDASAFPALFRAEYRFVWTSLRRLGVPPRDIEDVAHEVFLEIHRQLSRFDPRRPVRPWLFAFAVRFAADYRKQARVRHEGLGGVGIEDVADPSTPADARVEAREACELVAEGLRGVDFDRRAVFILFELEEVPMAEIASALGLPLNTAYSRLRLAREEFAAAVRRIQARRGAR